MRRWPLGGLAAVAALGFVGCKGVGVDLERVVGSGVSTEDTRSVTDFTEVSIETGLAAAVTAGADLAVTVSGDDNIVPVVETLVEDGVLIVRVRQGVSIQPKSGLAVTVAAPVIASVGASGGSSVTFTDDGGESLVLEASGGANLTAGSLQRTDLDVAASGGAQVTLDGAAASLSAAVSGGSQLHASDLTAEDVVLTGSGGALGELKVSRSVTADLSGGASFCYEGEPDTVNRNLSGGSSFNPCR